MADQKLSKSPWRLSFVIPDLSSSNLAAAAVQLQIEGVTKPEDLEDPGTTKGRTAISSLVKSIIESSIAEVASGSTGSVELGDRPEEFFQRARTKPQDHEMKPQELAIKDFLGLDHDAELMLSEQELVAAAIRASKELGGKPDYCLSDLIRDGIRRVGQEMVSNAVNRQNRKAGSGSSYTSPGANWHKYEAAYQQLKLEVGTPAWDRRKPYITLGYIAQESKTNVIQIRRWAESTGREIVAAPGPDEDQTAGCQIVNDKL